MIVRISDFGCSEKNFVKYEIFQLTQNQINYLKENLDEDMVVDENKLTLTMYFDDKLYPFQSNVSKTRLDDFIAREEIEMAMFLSGFLEDI